MQVTLPFLNKRKESPRIRLLRSLSLFSDLRGREARVVAGLMHDRDYLKGEVIFDQGDDGQALYVILSGRVAIIRDDPEAEVLVLGPGQFFGELALLDDAPRMAQARAHENCKLAVLFRGEFNGLLETHAVIASKVAVRIARELGVRLRAAMITHGHGGTL